MSCSSFVIIRRNDIIYFEDHLDDLSSELKLLFLGKVGFVDLGFSHIGVSILHAVDSVVGVFFSDLLGLALGEGLDWVETGVVSEGSGDVLESVSEGADGVLFNIGNFVSGLSDGEGAGDFGSTTSPDDFVGLDEVADDAHGIVDTSDGLVDDHLGASSDEDGDGLGLFALFDDEHSFVAGSELNFSDGSGLSEFIGGDFFESGDDSGSGGDGDEFNVGSGDPSDGGEFVLEEEMVGLIIEAPLAHDDIGSGLLASSDLVLEVLLFLGVEFVVIFGAGDVEVVFGFGFGGFEGAGENKDFGILDLFSHLWVGDVLVHEDSVDESGVLETASGFSGDFDEVKVDIFSFEVGDGEDGIDGDSGKFCFVFIDDFGSEGDHGGFDESLVVIFIDVDFFGDFSES